MRVMGIDPGLRSTGWGVIEFRVGRLSHIANGQIRTGEGPLPVRLKRLFEALSALIEEFAPEAAAVEQTFVNKDALGTLKLGQARGIALLAPALAGVAVGEYAPNAVKKAVVGAGKAEKEQIENMVRRYFPGARIAGPDAADALAVAICHAYHLQTNRQWQAALLRA